LEYYYIGSTFYLNSIPMISPTTDTHCQDGVIQLVSQFLFFD
jgi:hypothetical protein